MPRLVNFGQMNLVDGCDQLTMFQLLFVLLTIRTISAIEDEWSPVQLIPVDYDRTKAPPVGTSGPLNISLSVSIIQLMGINEAEQSMTIDIMYHQRWTDRRLFFPRHNHEVISLDMSLRAKLWMPDVYVINSLSPGVVQLVPLYMELESNTSQLVITSRQTVKLRCPMDLFNFPQDTQKCDIELSLMTTPSSKASLVWESFGLNPKRWFPNFHVINSKVADCESVRGPSYSCIKGQIKLFRNVSYYMIRIYGPSFLMVITSFVGFWVPPCGYPGRIALALTPLLTLVTQENQVNSEVNVSYVVALHIWMIFSLFFVL
ncbi:Glycine receptor subunit alpha-2 [Halotydeus destructor]|nr:Glycine receptor subunit alpha-2 [Halotydeus destructor]